MLPLIEGLQSVGFRVWYDAGIEAGTEWPEYIAEHIVGCTCVVAFITQHALASKNCRQEINFAIDEDKPLLAAYLEECEITAGMRMRLNSLQAIYRYRHDCDADFLTALTEAALIQPCKAFATQEDVSAEEAYRRGEAAFAQDNFGQAVHWYRIATAQGHIGAMCRLGQCLEEGIGVEKDPIRAVAWYQKAADLGDPIAQNCLSLCFGGGIGVEVDLEKMTYWCRKAAEQGLVLAQYHLGWFYHSGRGVEKDFAEAIVWYEKAAEQGSDIAQYRLGCIYECGLAGVEECRGKALLWYRRAADNGNFLAKQELINLL